MTCCNIVIVCKSVWNDAVVLSSVSRVQNRSTMPVRITIGNSERDPAVPRGFMIEPITTTSTSSASTAGSSQRGTRFTVSA